ncbi:nicotinate phosphoribosyltransferase [Ruegeria phage vB_RpoS-V10]|nr:nicotinate phosphoribosyltransferase [Ruegeria phage vB_RpoS-V10]
MLDFTNTTTLNPILRTDSYKTSHFNQYPAGATRVSSYIEARGGDFAETVFFGLQAFIKAYLLNPITMDDVAEARDLYEAHGVPFNTTDWAYIVIEHGGYLPIEICAVPEGTVMGVRNVQVQVTNTDNALPWLTSYVETALLRAIWYPSTVATLSRRMKQFIYQGLVQTSDDPDGQINFKLHDFGARGATSSEAAMLGGMGHLVNFMGTDTVEAIVGARRFYGEPMAGFSIPATEHSTMTSWGRDREVDAYRNLLVKNPTGLVACVSDSYDIFNAVRHIWGEQLRDEVMAREGTLVIRPDSGNPTVMPLDIIELAMEKFGFTVNSKGFRVLPSQVRVIQGDGMDGGSIPHLLQNAIDRGISVDNFAMGMGGGLLQKVNRDTMKYAMKANAIEIDGVWHDVYKDPITDQGKQSKKGRQALINYNGELVTIREDAIPQGAHGPARNYLRPVYRNGALLVDDSFAAIRARAAI